MDQRIGVLSLVLLVCAGCRTTPPAPPPGIRAVYYQPGDPLEPVSVAMDGGVELVVQADPGVGWVFCPGDSIAGAVDPPPAGVKAWRIGWGVKDPARPDGQIHWELPLILTGEPQAAALHVGGAEFRGLVRVVLRADGSHQVAEIGLDELVERTREEHLSQPADGR